MIKDPHRAEWDAHTLAEAEQIKADKDRFNKATSAAKKIMKERDEQTRAMRKVAKKDPLPLDTPEKTNTRSRASTQFTQNTPVKSSEGVTTFIG